MHIMELLHCLLHHLMNRKVVFLCVCGLVYVYVLLFVTVNVNVTSRAVHRRNSTYAGDSRWKRIGDGSPRRSSHRLTVFVYSAIFDDRTTNERLPVVRIFVLAEEPLPLDKPGPAPRCLARFSDRKDHVLLKMGWKDAVRNTRRQPEDKFRERIFTCFLLDEFAPQEIGLVFLDNATAEFMLPVEVPSRIHPLRKVAVCVQPSFGHIDHHRIIEWMAMLQLLEVDHVTVYDHSLSAETLALLQYYEQRGFVTVNKVTSPPGQYLKIIFALCISECVLRHIHTHRHVLVFDFDEIIMPQKDKTYPEFIARIQKSNGPKPIAFFSMRNVYYFLEMGASSNSTEIGHSYFLRYQKHVEQSAFHLSSKSVINPRACIAVNNHYCLTLTSSYKTKGQYLNVHSSFGIVQHYRSNCPRGKKACTEMMNKPLLNTRMNLWKDPLIQRRRQVYQDLGFDW